MMRNARPDGDVRLPRGRATPVVVDAEGQPRTRARRLNVLSAAFDRPGLSGTLGLSVAWRTEGPSGGVGPADGSLTSLRFTLNLDLKTRRRRVRRDRSLFFAFGRGLDSGRDASIAAFEESDARPPLHHVAANTTGIPDTSRNDASGAREQTTNVAPSPISGAEEGSRPTQADVPKNFGPRSEHVMPNGASPVNDGSAGARSSAPRPRDDSESDESAAPDLAVVFGPIGGPAPEPPTSLFAGTADRDADNPGTFAAGNVIGQLFDDDRHPESDLPELAVSQHDAPRPAPDATAAVSAADSATTPEAAAGDETPDVATPEASRLRAAATSAQAPYQPELQQPAPRPPRPVPAGWYPDPAGHAELRYWDGRWTAHVANDRRLFLSPLSGPAPPPVHDDRRDNG